MLRPESMRRASMPRKHALHIENASSNRDPLHLIYSDSMQNVDRQCPNDDEK